MHLDVWLIIVKGVLIGLDWVLPMMQFKFCMSHVHAYFMHTYYFLSLYLVVIVFSLSLSLSRMECEWHLSANPLQFGTLLVLSLLLLILLVPLFTFGSAMRRPSGFLGELSETWCSSRGSCCSVELFWHSSTGCHLDLGLGFSYGGTLKVSLRVYIGVLLQHTRHQYLCTSFCHDISRYKYRSYPRSYIRGTTCPVGIAS